MNHIRNEFSWSKSRNGIFRTCPRQYYFNYYAYWGGWEKNALVRTRQIYVLKNLKNRFMWAGEKVKLPPGYSMLWSGQYEYMIRAQQRLMVVVPMTLIIIFLLLYFNFRNVAESLIVMLSVPVSLTGGLWLMYLMGYNMSVAVGVGFIALAGVAAETGVVMLVYLDLSYHKFKAKYGDKLTRKHLLEAIEEGAALRVRP